MANERVSVHGMWSSRAVFVMATVGSAVGLGNVWKFPYITGEYGGGAFVLVYLLCIALIGIPIMMAEVMLGRRGRQSPINTMRTLAYEEKVSPNWRWLGWAGVLAGFLILSFYSVIAGWALYYIGEMADGAFYQASAETAAATFERFLSDPLQMILWQTLFMAATVFIIAKGVIKGLEKAIRWFMPLLFILLFAFTLGIAPAPLGRVDPLLIPPDPNDQRNIFLEIRAGTGGAEAALFAGDLHRMYLRYAEAQGEDQQCCRKGRRSRFSACRAVRCPRTCELDRRDHI